MTFHMIAQLWNTNAPAIVSCDADLTENYMYISMKFRTGVHVFCWEVGVFNRSCFQSVSCNDERKNLLGEDYCIRPNIIKYKNLMNTKNVSVLRNLCHLIMIIFAIACPP